MLQDLLVLRNVQVARKINAPDGQGGVTTTVTTTTLPKAVMWSPSQSKSYISEKLAHVSSHILVTIPSYYSFSEIDDIVLYNGQTFKVQGFDDVMNMGEIMVVGLEKIV